MTKVFVYMFFLIVTRIKQLMAISNALFRKKITFYPKFVSEFEKRFANYIGSDFGLTFCNGTSAIEAALFAIGVKPGDEIIVPSCTFHASIDPIINVGATPVFADVNESTITACPEDIASKMSSRTKAIILVHLFGNPADIHAVQKKIGDRNIQIIEDASHAHGAKIGNDFCGAIGDIAIFSLQGSKAVAAGEGGIAVTNNERYYLRMSLWGHFDRHADRFSKIGAEEFKYTGYGYKRRIAPLSVLIANADMDYLDWMNNAMNDTTAKLDDHLSLLSGFKSIRCIPDARKGGFFGGYPILIDKEGPQSSDVISALRRKGIEALPYPFAFHHKLKIYNDHSLRKNMALASEKESNDNNVPLDLPVTESLESRLFSLPKKYLITMNTPKIKQLVSALSEL